jgi:hypothetical protein
VAANRAAQLKALEKQYQSLVLKGQKAVNSVKVKALKPPKVSNPTLGTKGIKSPVKKTLPQAVKVPNFSKGIKFGRGRMGG